MSSWHHCVSSPLIRIARMVSTPVELGQRGDRRGSRRFLRGGRTGVFEIEEHEIGAGPCGDLAHVLVTRGRRELAAAGPGRLGHRMLHSVQMVPAARRAARRCGVETEQVAVHRLVVCTERPAEMRDAARCLAQPCHGRLHGHRAHVWIVDRHEGASRTQVLVGEKLLCVVNRCDAVTSSARNTFIASSSGVRGSTSATRASISSARAWRGIGSTYSGRSARSDRSMAR